MKSANHRLVLRLLLGVTLLAGPAIAQDNLQRLNTDGIARAFGKQGEVIGEMYKVSLPRSDLSVKVGDIAIKPALALMAWAGFIKSGNTAVTYGDLVVLEDEINPVISLRRKAWNCRLSTTISCMKRLTSCLSTLSDVGTRWQWRPGFERRSD
jgi:hypothetical protein